MFGSKFAVLALLLGSPLTAAMTLPEKPTVRAELAMTHQQRSAAIDVSTNSLEKRFDLNDWRLQVAIVLATTKLSVMTWQSIGRSCAEISEQETVGKKVVKGVWDCGIGAIAAVTSQLIAAVGAINTAQTVIPLLRGWLERNYNQARSLGERDAHAAAAVPHVSALLGGIEVRHIGHWADAVTSSALQKRSEGAGGDENVIHRPVYGAKMNGQDFHLSLIETAPMEAGEVSNNGSSVDDFFIRLGFGNGDLHARADPPNYFTLGGIDVQYNSGLLGSIPNMPEYDADVFGYIYDQLYCSMHVNFAYNQMEHNQMYLQLYDLTIGGTRMGANFAAFGDNLKSGIEQMGGYKGGLEVDEICAI